jgi:hypothetical protein
MVTSAGLRALDSSLDGSQCLRVISDGYLSDGQQGFQLRLSQQVAFDPQDQPLEFGAIGSGHVGQSSTMVRLLRCSELHTVTAAPWALERD